MKITVTYFAMLKERKGTSSESLTVDAPITLAELYTTLFPVINATPAVPVMFSRNGTMAKGADFVADDDHVVFLPPLGGG